MSPSNPACYECPVGLHSLHTWRRQDDNPKQAECLRCELVLNEQHTREVFDER